jgi:hypothetical protein
MKKKILVVRVLEQVLYDFNHKWDSHGAVETGLSMYVDDILNILDTEYPEIIEPKESSGDLFDQSQALKK